MRTRLAAGQGWMASFGRPGALPRERRLTDEAAPSAHSTQGFSGGRCRDALRALR